MFDDVNNLLGVALWPVIVAFLVLFFRSPLSGLIGAISRKIEEAENVSVRGPGGTRVDIGRAKSALSEAADRSEQSSQTRGTGDGSVVTGSAGGPGTGSGDGGPPSPAPAAESWHPVRISNTERDSAIERAQRSADKLTGLRILWVDDNPQRNIRERRLFRSLNVDVTTATSTGQAMDEMTRGDFDVVISDMTRGDDPRAGLAMLEAMQGSGFDLPVIFYVGNLDRSMGVPGYAFGVTNRPDELLHFVIEIAERR